MPVRLGNAPVESRCNLRLLRRVNRDFPVVARPPNTLVAAVNPSVPFPRQPS